MKIYKQIAPFTHLEHTKTCCRIGFKTLPSNCYDDNKNSIPMGYLQRTWSPTILPYLLETTNSFILTVYGISII